MTITNNRVYNGPSQTTEYTMDNINNTVYNGPS